MNDGTKLDSAHLEAETLSALIEGELPDAAARSAQDHLDDCAACRAEVDGLRAMKSQLARLADVTPPRALWTRIEAAHAASAAPVRPTPVWLRWLWPATALVAAAALALVLWPRGEERAPGTPGLARSGTPGALSPLAASGQRAAHAARARDAVSRAESAYRSAIEGLRAAVEQDTRTLAPKAKAAIARGLSEIDAAIERCRGALRTAPDDARAQEALLAAYQQKADLLNELLQEAM